MIELGLQLVGASNGSLLKRFAGGPLPVSGAAA